MDRNKYFTLHDIRLPLGEYFFQTDSLILSKNVHFIVGVKNIAGEVKFDGFNQMIRTYNDQSEGMQNPLSQAFLHQQQLQKWLQPYNVPPIPIEYVVVFSNPRTILTIQGGITLALKKICHAPNLLMKLQELEYKHPQPKATSEEIAEIGHLIRKSHVPLTPNILDNYKLKEKDVPTGVLCVECRHLPMVRKYGYWQCPICNTTSKDAHIGALYAYFLLIKPFISVSEFAEFAHIPSIKTAYRLLSALQLHTSGIGKSTVYHAPDSLFSNQ